VKQNSRRAKHCNNQSVDAFKQQIEVILRKQPVLLLTPQHSRLTICLQRTTICGLSYPALAAFGAQVIPVKSYMPSDP
jgi:hypothetical protein